MTDQTTPTPEEQAPDQAARVEAILKSYEDRLTAMQAQHDQERVQWQAQMASVQAQAEANARGQAAPVTGPTTPPAWHNPETHADELLEAMTHFHDQPRDAEQALVGDYTFAPAVRGMYIRDPLGRVLYLQGVWLDLEKLSA